MTRKYHHLLTLERDGCWYPQFGDYDKQVVIDERRDCYVGSGTYGYKAKQVKIVTLADVKQALTEYLSDLNAEAIQAGKGERFFARMSGEA